MMVQFTPDLQKKKKKNPQIRFIKNEWKGMAIEITDSKFPGFANFGSLF